MPGPHQVDPLTFEDLFSDELDEVTKPEASPTEGRELALGSNIYAVRRDKRPAVSRAPLDGIDAVLVAYLLDVDPSTSTSDADRSGPNHSSPARVASDRTKPERPE